NEFAPFIRKSVQKLGINLKLLQWHLVDSPFLLELVPLSLLVSGDVILSTVRSSTKHNLVSPSCDFVIFNKEYRNQAIIHGDRVNIQSQELWNVQRGSLNLCLQEYTFKLVQCHNCSGKDIMIGMVHIQDVRDSKYFMEKMLLAKQDEAGEFLTDEQNDFLFVDASRMEEIEELSENICLMAR
ncbi:hypothetical protein Tco_0884773, partial [Tanacetum coccineum]